MANSGRAFRGPENTRGATRLRVVHSGGLQANSQPSLIMVQKMPYLVPGVWLVFLLPFWRVLLRGKQAGSHQSPVTRQPTYSTIALLCTVSVSLYWILQIVWPMAGGRIRDKSALMHVEDLEQIVLRITLLCFIGNVEQRMDTRAKAFSFVGQIIYSTLAFALVFQVSGSVTITTPYFSAVTIIGAVLLLITAHLLLRRTAWPWKTYFMVVSSVFSAHLVPLLLFQLRVTVRHYYWGWGLSLLSVFPSKRAGTGKCRLWPCSATYHHCEPYLRPVYSPGDGSWHLHPWCCNSRMRVNLGVLATAKPRGRGMQLRQEGIGTLRGCGTPPQRNIANCHLVLVLGPAGPSTNTEGVIRSNR